MFREEENQVALFIDWDNLAISTAADFGGAAPDVRAIIRVAQRYGTVILARAFAEWQVPSDRLAVYRAGVDPIYAPTFRFEPDPVNQAPRGKSLADPCLVADCIDTLHLMPAINHFVLVSGDKDLIPIVRLVQLRGRKVVVIGPDYVAAILREMADEYISYRSIIESGEATANVPDQYAAGTSARRRRAAQARGGGPSTAAPSAPAVPPQPVAQATTPPPAPAPSRPPRGTPPAPQPARPAAPEPVAPARSIPLPLERLAIAEAEEPSENGGVATAAELPTAEVEAVEAAATSEEIGSLMSTIEQILKEREAQGKPRLRATNLKDLLMARIRGFNERRYGFGKFKDLLAAAERANVLEVTHSGQVQWVTLPKRAAEAPAAPAPAAPQPAPAPEPVVTNILESIGVTPPSAAPAEPEVTAADQERDVELIRFIAELRSRSRWLTYTYVLTNLISHLSQQMSPQAAESAARSSLNRLVQEGVLRVDREPREIEVAGARHRVRMCHLEESNPVVQSVLTAQAEEAAAAGEVTAAEAAPVAAPEAPAQPTPAPAPTLSLGLDPLPSSLVLPTEVYSASVVTAPVTPEPVAETPSAPEPEATPGPATPVAPAAPAVAAPEPAVEAAPEAAEPQAPTMADAFTALREVVREATGPEKPAAGAASVKTRLGRKLGSFDERSFGFSKFKDFLLAAEREGFVRVEVSGPATRVALPEPAAQ